MDHQTLNTVKSHFYKDAFETFWRRMSSIGSEIITLIPCYEWSGEVEVSNHIERNSVSFYALNGLVIVH